MEYKNCSIDQKKAEKERGGRADEINDKCLARWQT